MTDMTTYQAIALVDGLEQGDDDTMIDAWQHIIDEGMHMTLPGAYGRMAAQLIADGICEEN